MIRGLIDAHRPAGRSAQLPSTRCVTVFQTASGSRARRSLRPSAMSAALAGIPPGARLTTSPIATLAAAHEVVFRPTAFGPQMLSGICTGRYIHGEIVEI